ncbi:MAG TPA: carboxypeptidase regulatory-like domain-containing protein [Verrucomicrobiae bacterium]|nr:carboxypeptidase regulatory-like domain-containing protein [Verrucomicrobiae bacterium]
MLLRRLPVFFLLLALGVLPGSAQNAPSRRAVFSIGGSIRDESDHHAMESISVTLKQLTGNIVNSVFTRGNGDFEFDGLGNGDYIVEINVRDYERFQQTVTISGASRMGLSIFLSRTGKAANPPIQLSISAHQLSVPHKAHDEFEKGMSLIYMKSDYRAAITQFQLAIKDFPTYYEAYAEEGNAYYQLEEMGPAEEALQKSVDLSSGQYADAMFTLAAILTDTKRFKEAEAVSRRGISVDSSSWRGPFELARALTALKQPEEAEKSAQQSRDLMPDNPPVYLLLANIHIQRKDYAALLRDLDDYLRLAPIGPEADQARKTRERVQAIVSAPKNESAGSGKDQSDDDDDDADTAPEKNASPPPAQDTSGLPALPPPTPGNQ